MAACPLKFQRLFNVFWPTLTLLMFGWSDLVSLFNGISTLFRLFNAEAILLEEQKWYYLTHSWEDKGVHNFPKGICPKVNVIARREYELGYYDSAVHRFNHYTTRTPRWMIWALPSISNSFSPLSKSSGIVSSAQITIGATVTFMLHSFLVLSQVLSSCLTFCFLSFSLWDPLRR